MITGFELLEAAAVAELGVAEYHPIRQDYYWAIWTAMTDYLSNPKARAVAYKNDFKIAVVESFVLAYKQGWVDAGEGLTYPEDATPEDKQWIAAKIDAEFGFIESLFAQLKELRGEGPEAWQGEPERRAENYCKTLDGVYNEGKLRGGRDAMLQFDGEDGQESCPTCQKWKGKKHRASFWVKRGLIPGQPGNPNFECRGFNCRHYLIHVRTGKLWTL